MNACGSPKGAAAPRGRPDRRRLPGCRGLREPRRRTRYGSRPTARRPPPDSGAGEPDDLVADVRGIDSGDGWHQRPDAGNGYDVIASGIRAPPCPIARTGHSSRPERSLSLPDQTSGARVLLLPRRWMTRRRQSGEDVGCLVTAANASGLCSSAPRSIHMTCQPWPLRSKKLREYMWPWSSAPSASRPPAASAAAPRPPSRRVFAAVVCTLQAV